MKTFTLIAEQDIVALERDYGVSLPENLESVYDWIRTGQSEVRKARTGVEAKRKRLKEPHVAAGKAIDEAAKAVTARLLAIEEPLKAARAEVENAREIAEQKRVADLRSRIDEIKELGNIRRDATPEQIENRILGLNQITLFAGDFGEFFAEACAELDIAKRYAAHAMDEAVRYRDEQAELLKLREEKEAADAKAAADAAELAELRQKVADAAPAPVAEPEPKYAPAFVTAPGPAPAPQPEPNVVGPQMTATEVVLRRALHQVNNAAQMLVNVEWPTNTPIRYIALQKSADMFLAEAQAAKEFTS